MGVKEFSMVATRTAMMEDRTGRGGTVLDSAESRAVPKLTQINQDNSVMFQSLTQNLNIAYASNDPQIIAEAWAAIDAARSETASVSAQASHAVGSLQSQLEASR